MVRKVKKTIYMLITSFSKDFIKTVGIYFEHNHELCSRLNWETKEKGTQVKQQLNRWEMHNLTFYWKKTSHYQKARIFFKILLTKKNILTY